MYIIDGWDDLIGGWWVRSRHVKIVDLLSTLNELYDTLF